MNDEARRAPWRRIRVAMSELHRQWLYDPNVRLIDYGFPEREGMLRDDEEPCIRVHVLRKFPLGAALEAAIANGVTHDVLPESVAGIRVHCQQRAYQLHSSRTATSTASDRRARVRPLRGGISISDSYRPIAGTLGAPVIERRTGDPMILSNWHVLSGAYGRTGWTIQQPGRADGGTAADRVATLHRHAMSANVDAAVAKLDPAQQMANSQTGIGRVQGTTTAQLAMRVAKSGRTTGVTEGVVTGVDGTQRIYYTGVGYRLIRHVFSVTPGDAELSLGGDSGSLWVERDTLLATGLHFGGNQPGQPEVALAIDLEPVLDALQVDLYV